MNLTVNWARAISRGNRGWTIGRSGRDVGNSCALVPYVSYISCVGVSDRISHDLGSSVRKLDTVFALGRVSVAGLVVPEVCSAVVSIALNTIAKFVDWRSVGVNRGSIGRNGNWSVKMTSGSVGKGDGHKTGKSNKYL
jgi:hypothetical protein